eukprot:15435441-Alexandrium_andersonii.AAC.1
MEARVTSALRFSLLAGLLQIMFGCAAAVAREAAAAQQSGDGVRMVRRCRSRVLPVEFAVRKLRAAQPLTPLATASTQTKNPERKYRGRRAVQCAIRVHHARLCRAGVEIGRETTQARAC